MTDDALGWPFVIPITPAGPAIDRCAMPKPLANPRLPVVTCTAENPLLEPRDRAASFDPVELPGLSISMPPTAWSPPALLLCRRCRFEPRVAVRERDAAPGPGALFGGAAAIGITPFPPTMPPVEPALP